MIKSRSIIATILGMVLITLFLISCGDDNNPINPKVHELIGTWELTKLTIMASDTTIITEEMLSLTGSYWTLKFKSDNTFESNYNLDELETETGTWNTSGNELTVTFDSGSIDKFEYSLDGNVFTLEWADIEEGEEETLSGEFKKQ